MKEYKFQEKRFFPADPARVFACLDDLSVTGMHMSQSSMPMMGGKMELEFLSTQKTGLGTRYQWTGQVLWWKLDFTVAVTKWIEGSEKTWQTEGDAQLILYSAFKMHLYVHLVTGGSEAFLSISYDLPNGFFQKLLCRIAGGWYARWCLKNMLRDAAAKLAAPGTIAHA
ncbi:MAG: SRPBCC family protein [Sphingobacteriales bacterium]|nr:MAG: SRPBCC family protein [Sphingobacteriales bacterium]